MSDFTAATEAIANVGPDAPFEAYAKAAVRAFLAQNGQREWMCEYPEFNDPACYVGHPNPEPQNTRQPRKHESCRWVVVVGLVEDKT